MNVRTVSAIVTVFALVQIALAVLLVFAPAETASVLFAGTEVPPVLLSLVGAALFGFGQLGWMTRQTPLGGIYGRPALMANLGHFVIGGLALARAADTPVLWGAAAFYLVGAVFYGALLFSAPKAPAAAGH